MLISSSRLDGVRPFLWACGTGDDLSLLWGPDGRARGQRKSQHLCRLCPASRRRLTHYRRASRGVAVNFPDGSRRSNELCNGSASTVRSVAGLVRPYGLAGGLAGVVPSFGASSFFGSSFFSARK